MSRLLKLRTLRDKVAREISRVLITGPDEDSDDCQKYIEDVVGLRDGCGSACNRLRVRIDPFDFEHVDLVRKLAKASACVAILEARAVPRAPHWHRERIKTLREHSKRWTTRAAMENVLERGRFR